MSAHYAADPAWSEIHAAMVDPRPDLSATERMLLRIRLAHNLRDREVALGAREVAA